MPFGDQFCHARAFMLARGAAIDHGQDRLRIDVFNDFGGFGNRVDEIRHRWGQRLNAVCDTGVLRHLGDSRPALDSPFPGFFQFLIVSGFRQSSLLR